MLALSKIVGRPTAQTVIIEEMRTKSVLGFEPMLYNVVSLRSPLFDSVPLILDHKEGQETSKLDLVIHCSFDGIDCKDAIFHLQTYHGISAALNAKTSHDIFIQNRQLQRLGNLFKYSLLFRP